MKIVATVMVRDEVDVIAAMIEHHLDQGVDLIIATDNASVDGTTEVLQAYADLGVVELHHDPVHRKQQHSVVTTMARRAFVEHGADWVLNVDADEFFVPVDTSLTLREALEHIPLELGAFTAEVTNLVGPPALRGSGIDRLLWRDRRSEDELHAVGVFAQPTPNAVHRGDADVVVAQGNHFVSIESAGQPDPAFAIEVLHLPWRSWEQTERKVVNAGRAYAENPDLTPSRNHHGMADYRRYLGGRLRYHFELRLPTRAGLAAGLESGSFVEDTYLRDQLEKLVSRALRPDLLEPCLDSSHDEVVPDDVHERDVELAALFIDVERDRDEMAATVGELEARIAQLALERDRALARANMPASARIRRRARRAAAVVADRLPGR